MNEIKLNKNQPNMLLINTSRLQKFTCICIHTHTQTHTYTHFIVNFHKSKHSVKSFKEGSEQLSKAK